MKKKEYRSKEQLKADTLALAERFYNENSDKVTKQVNNSNFVFIGLVRGIPQFVNKYDKIEFSPHGGKNRLMWEECFELLRSKFVFV